MIENNGEVLRRAKKPTLAKTYRQEGPNHAKTSGKTFQAKEREHVYSLEVGRVWHILGTERKKQVI